jgi:hypothetical protein
MRDDSESPVDVIKVKEGKVEEGISSSVEEDASPVVAVVVNVLEDGTTSIEEELSSAGTDVVLSATDVSTPTELGSSELGSLEIGSSDLVVGREGRDTPDVNVGGSTVV